MQIIHTVQFQTQERQESIRLDVFQSKPKETAKGYEVLVIRAGRANSWNFSAEVLKEAVILWDAIECFADHNVYGESVHDLAGIFSNPRWSDTEQGIIADVRPTGPAADMLRMYAEEMLGENTPHPNMGFSPVLIFTAKGEDVEHILRVRSEDMVINPAFLTKFIAEFQQRSNVMKKKYKMPDGSIVLIADGERVPDGAVLFSEEAEQHMTAMREITGAQAEISAAVQGAKEMHMQACQDLLKSSLDAELSLSDPAKTLIRQRFEKRTFKAQELADEIKTFKDAFAAQSAGAVVAGPRQVTGMFSSEDQLQAAMDDLLDAPREQSASNLRVHRFSGIREAYLMLTGDYGFVGDTLPQLAQFQGTTATFPNLVANALNKAIVKHWKKYGEAGYNWWEKITTVEPFESLHEITWLRLGTIASLPEVGEGEDYPELKLGDNGENSTFIKYGGYLSFTLEAMDKDNTRKLRQAPREIAMAAIRNISEKIAYIFTQASGAGPTLEDTGALFNSTAVTTAGGHANLRTTALGTTYTEWDAIAAAMHDQPMLVANESGYYGTGKKQAIEPAHILVPRALKAPAEALFLPRWESQAQNVAAVSPTWGGRVQVSVVPEFTDATDFAAVIDKDLVPGIMLGTRFGLMPQIIIAGDQRDPAMFANDESRLKVRHFLATGIGNWTALHKSNVAG